MTGDAEKTKDRQTDIRKSGPGVLGTRMEMHNNLIASSLYSAFFSLSLFFKALLLYKSLKP
jgi:hypothetical protein